MRDARDIQVRFLTVPFFMVLGGVQAHVSIAAQSHAVFSTSVFAAELVCISPVLSWWLWPLAKDTLPSAVSLAGANPQAGTGSSPSALHRQGAAHEAPAGQEQNKPQGTSSAQGWRGGRCTGKGRCTGMEGDLQHTFQRHRPQEEVLWAPCAENRDSHVPCPTSPHRTRQVGGGRWYLVPPPQKWQGAGVLELQTWNTNLGAPGHMLGGGAARPTEARVAVPAHTPGGFAGAEGDCVPVLFPSYFVPEDLRLCLAKNVMTEEIKILYSRSVPFLK